MDISTLILFYIVFSLIIYTLLLQRKKTRSVTKTTKNVLIVTAHPDDECMFFSPTILHLNSTPNVNVHILCLSSGNFYGLGHLRKKELVASCHVLGIRPMNVAVVESEALQDNADIFWDPSAVSKCILHYIKRINAHMLVTFDEGGVSGHRNHASCYRAVQKLVNERKLPDRIKAYSLVSVFIVRKYISLLDLPFCVLTASKMYISAPSDIWRAQRAMRAHGSQYVWFRILYIVFSRYMLVNTLEKISAC
ncbi:N-acetylglucosaminyl-phosphatidylinositol de-N-acetylase-like [Amphiura filiformis]|uniref:N-acetylglucosaminyl-phosphatidylinositol de-N-acetylase-like n=1 Tax=Amphiura filiformis TaxID=82378 RepID=UPI003B228B6B